MMHNNTILVIDDEELIRVNLKRIYSKENYRVLLSKTGSEGIETVRNEKIDLVLLDINLPDINGLDVLVKLKEIDSELLVIVITGYSSVENAVNALKLGAYDYIKKPFKADSIKLITKLAIETLKLKKTVTNLKLLQGDNKTKSEQILGESDVIKSVKEQIEHFSKYDSETVLITGKSGVGKELVAKALHYKSPRSEEPFIAINCASIPDSLLESELFGYEKGAFTDAKKRKIGLLEQADGGTLFLDEIGEMSVNLQAKLLRILENTSFRRVGGEKEISVDVRIITATNINFKETIEKKLFREDLYYRLNVLRLEVPGLKERGEDVILLANYFLDKYKKKFNKKIKGFSKSALEAMKNYNWPGNIRELKNIIERISILQRTEIIELSNLPTEIQHDENSSSSISYPNSSILKELQNNSSIDSIKFEEIINNMEKELIIIALRKSGNNTTKAAKILNIPRETLRYKITKYNLKART